MCSVGFEIARLQRMLSFERQACRQGFSAICGIDEAGRGPLAGPVIAAACILPEHVLQDPFLFRGLDDSKKLTPALREELFYLLTEHPGVRYGVGRSEHDEIDSVNILQATILAMQRAVQQLTPPPDILLVDGLKLPIDGIEVRQIIKGDQLSLSVAAASVIAKVTRDRMMRQYHKQFPLYGFNQHKGYATEGHRLALSEHGPCPIHRKSFSPIAELYSCADRTP